MSDKAGDSMQWVRDIKVLSFDLDDTLWDCPPAIERAEIALFNWFERHAPEVVAEHGRRAAWLKRASVVAHYFGEKL